MLTIATGSVLPTSPVQLMGRVELSVVGLADGRWPNWFGFSVNRGLDEGVVAGGEPELCEVTAGGELPHAARNTAPRIAHAARTGRECFKDAHRAEEGANWNPDDSP